MATMEQVRNGIVRYIDSEILPHLTGFKKYGLGIYTALAADNLEATINKYKNTPAVAMLGIIDSNDNIDIDKVYRIAINQVPAGERFVVPIPLIGDLTLTKNDIDKLYELINR